MRLINHKGMRKVFLHASFLLLELLLFSSSRVTAFAMHRCPTIRDHQRRSRLSGALSSQNFGGDSFNLVVLGDLHMEDDMSAHERARQDCLAAIEQLQSLAANEVDEKPDTNYSIINDLKSKPAGELTIDELRLLLASLEVAPGSSMEQRHAVTKQHHTTHMVSLGDLGRKDIRNEPGDAGTTLSFDMAKGFLDSFDMPYDLVTGNHDLEGLDEFDTDEGNVKAWMTCFDDRTAQLPQFSRYIGKRTLLLGLSTTRFRDAPYSSHEVYIDDEQLDWFRAMVESHSQSDGWTILVFSHAPPMGCGLRVLQNVHVTNGCAWLNHSSPSRRLFLQIAKANPQIKLWCSGHFHLSQDNVDALSQVGACTFCQVGVMGPVSSRDGLRQTRLVQGTEKSLKVYTINHHLSASSASSDDVNIRLDTEIDLETGDILYSKDDGNLQEKHMDCSSTGGTSNDDNWFRAYVPQEEDGCLLETVDGLVIDASDGANSVSWWHMADGKVLGVHGGQLVEYDAETLSPLGIVVNTKALGDRQVMVVDDGQAVVLVSTNNETDEQHDTASMEVVHPNEDGSYWRKYQRNKKVRMQEKAREALARSWLEEQRE